jgi:hypothetical protein
MKETMYRDGTKKGSLDRYAEKGKKKNKKLRNAEIWMTDSWDDVISKDESKQITRKVCLGSKVKDLGKRWPCC